IRLLVSVFMLRQPPLSTFFPYTTLFRSHHRPPQPLVTQVGVGRDVAEGGHPVGRRPDVHPGDRDQGTVDAETDVLSRLQHPLIRSEEHTSELQSRENLVCRLLLEKKKTL